MCVPQLRKSKIQRRRQQTGEPAFVSDLFKKLMELVELRIEVSKDRTAAELDVGGSEFLSLPMMTSGSRCRRVSLSKKIGFVNAAASTPAISGPGRYMQVLANFQGATDGPKSVGCAKKGKDALVAQLYQYQCSSVDAFGDSDHFIMPSDGGRASGKERQCTFVFSTDIQRGAWSAPIVPWLIR
jgi:hypothetical protein